MSDRDPGEQVAALEGRARNLRTAIGARKRAGAPADDLIAEHREVTEQLKALAAGPEPAAVVGAHPEETLQVEIVTTDSGLAAMREDWEGLLERSGAQSPFNTWEWLYPWWQVYGEGKQLRLVTVRDAGGVLVGLAPLMIGKRKRGGRGCEKRVLALLGTGEGPLANGLEMLVAAERREQVLPTIWQACEGLAGEWDTVQFEEVWPSSDSWTSVMGQILREDYLVLAQTQRLGVTGALPDSFEACINQMPSDRRRRNLRAALRALEKAPVQVEYRRETSGEHLGDSLAALAAMSVQRQQSKGKHSAWLAQGFSECVGQAAALMAEKGRLRLDALLIDGAVRAVVLGFVLGDGYYGFQSGFDARFAEYSPNHCLWARCIESCIKEGLTRFDFGAGEHEYKAGYFAQRQAHGRLVAMKPRPRPLWWLGSSLARQAARQAAKSRLRRSE
jgi:CelD/BcsL family acetyltransferase involved in cellulose biosynthesis